MTHCVTKKLYVSAPELAEALGITGKQVRYWADTGRISAPQRSERKGSFRWWPLVDAVRIVRAHGLPVPASWGEVAATEAA